ncbi:hypothetical protein BgiMline_027642 [Biomphalaria glabrata]|nr:hypothetical protein BgiMline_025394 [Biomphalaria glabrata]
MSKANEPIPKASTTTAPEVPFIQTRTETPTAISANATRITRTTSVPATSKKDIPIKNTPTASRTTAPAIPAISTRAAISTKHRHNIIKTSNISNNQRTTTKMCDNSTNNLIYHKNSNISINISYCIKNKHYNNNIYHLPQWKPT